MFYLLWIFFAQKSKKKKKENACYIILANCEYFKTKIKKNRKNKNKKRKMKERVYEHLWCCCGKIKDSLFCLLKQTPNRLRSVIERITQFQIQIRYKSVFVLKRDFIRFAE
jgi:Na+/phosphate symporter